MKRISYFVLLAFISTLIISSCSDTKTYAELVDDENTLIANYINRNNIRVISFFPADNVWGANDYVLTKSGLYFHLSKAGIGDTLKLSNTVIPRYIQSTLDEVPVVISNWSTVDYPYPVSFVYGETSQPCAAFQEAFSYMKSNESEAKIIVPAEIGFPEYYNQYTFTPMHYQLKINFLK